MASVKITEILGSDSIAGSRNTLNSNFLILQNWINKYSSSFGIDLNNGILDISGQSTGSISAKLGKFNQISFPSSGLVTASISSAGVGTFTSLASTNLTASGTVTLNGSVSLGGLFTIQSGATGNFNGQSNFNGKISLGPASSFIDNSTVYNIGLTSGSDFPDTDSGFPHGGGYSTTSSAPYSVTGTESIIYADLGSTGGFNLSVGNGSTVSAVPEGLVLTIINTNDAGGVINTGIQGSFYTGFNTNSSQGGFNGAGITAPSGYAYRSSLQLRWEPRVDQSSATQKGSWVVLSATNMSV